MTKEQFINTHPNIKINNTMFLNEDGFRDFTEEELIKHIHKFVNEAINELDGILCLNSSRCHWIIEYNTKNNFSKLIGKNVLWRINLYSKFGIQILKLASRSNSI